MTSTTRSTLRRRREPQRHASDRRRTGRSRRWRAGTAPRSRSRLQRRDVAVGVDQRRTTRRRRRTASCRARGRARWRRARRRGVRRSAPVCFWAMPHCDAAVLPGRAAVAISSGHWMPASTSTMPRSGSKSSTRFSRVMSRSRAVRQPNCWPPMAWRPPAMLSCVAAPPGRADHGLQLRERAGAMDRAHHRAVQARVDVVQPAPGAGAGRPRGRRRQERRGAKVEKPPSGQHPIGVLRPHGSIKPPGGIRQARGRAREGLLPKRSEGFLTRRRTRAKERRRPGRRSSPEAGPRSCNPRNTNNVTVSTPCDSGQAGPGQPALSRSARPRSPGRIRRSPSTAGSARNG